MRLVIHPLQWMMSGAHPNFLTISRVPLQKKAIRSALSSKTFPDLSSKMYLRLKKSSLSRK